MLDTFRPEQVSEKTSETRARIKRLFLQRPVPRSHPRPLEALHPAFSAQSPFSRQQTACLILLVTAIALLLWQSPATLSGISYWFMWAAFMGNALIRLAACSITTPGSVPKLPASNENLPSYSVIVALYQEAAIVPQLLKAMLALDYPRDQLEILFALEADDVETLNAFDNCHLPPYVRVIKVPDGFPRTKPRALNHALNQAHGDLVVIYDAEDRPHPEQLLEAASTFGAGENHLACLQAPLRPTGGQGFIARQFTLEYAVQFDVLLPAMNALGLPFPLGGTSNHFKSEVLKTIGGWDAYNVTEDADLGIRLAQYGYSLGLISAPTFETPPKDARTWIPQRTRWIKGYIQTLLVHTRLNTKLKFRAWLSLFIGVGLSAAAAICYAPFTFLLLMTAILVLLQILIDPAQPLSAVAPRDIVLFVTGTLSGLLTLAHGARRTGLHLNFSDLLCAPGYWCLQSLAAGFALHQLITRPFHWDKTEHTPDADHKPLYEDAGGDYGQGHDHKRHGNHAAHQALG